MAALGAGNAGIAPVGNFKSSSQHSAMLVDDDGMCGLCVLD